MAMPFPAVAACDGDSSLLPKTRHEAFPDALRELLPYADHPVSLRERLLLLAAVDEHGSLPLFACLHVLRRSRDPVADLAALVLHGVLDVEATGPLDLSTRISRAVAFGERS